MDANVNLLLNSDLASSQESVPSNVSSKKIATLSTVSKPKLILLNNHSTMQYSKSLQKLKLGLCRQNLWF
jgi:hypothetical protein